MRSIDRRSIDRRSIDRRSIDRRSIDRRSIDRIAKQVSIEHCNRRNPYLFEILTQMLINCHTVKKDIQSIHLTISSV